MNPFDCPALRIAEDHCQGWRFHYPETITFTRKFMGGALWYPPVIVDSVIKTPCRIEIGCEETPGILWHEAFHGACHECPLAGDDRAWIEGFCNAFAACNDGIDRPPFIITQHVIERAPGHKWTMLYGIPEELILRKVGRGRSFSDSFRDFFFWACKTSKADPGALSRELKYNPATGLFLETLDS